MIQMFHHKLKKNKVMVMSDTIKFIGTKEVAEVLGCSLPTARSIMMRGSLNFSRYLFHSGVVLGCVRILHPCSRRFLSTSASVNPSLES